MIRTLLLLFSCTILWAGLPTKAEAQARVRRNVEVEWDAVNGASIYEVQVIRKDDSKKKPTRFKSKEPKWAATIKPGIYNMQIRSYDDRGVPGDWSPPSELTVKLPAVIALSPGANQVVNSTADKSEATEFKWEIVPGAAKYKFHAQSANGSWVSDREVEETSVSVDVPAGEFINWEVTAVDPKDEVGDKWEAPQSFEMRGPPLRKPTIEKPISQYIKELKWQQPDYVTSYTYNLKYFNPTIRKWEAVDSKSGYSSNTLALDTSKPSGKYRLQVQAVGDRRHPSPTTQMDFEMKGGFNDPSSLDNAILRESITKPTNFYAIASYLITKIDYEAKDYDNNNHTTFPAIGGIGRLGLGYQKADSKWGGFGIADYSGFVIKGQNFKFASIELHATRKLEFGQGGLLLFGTGLYSKELPLVKGSNIDGFSGVGKVRTIGPHAGFTYWLPLSSRFGMQANARAYYSLAGSGPGGEKIQSTLSYQMGLLGSYRLNNSWMGYAGYAYRMDHAQYSSSAGSTNSFAQSGDVNEVSVLGNYVNLILEFSF